MAFRSILLVCDKLRKRLVCLSLLHETGGRGEAQRAQLIMRESS